MTATRHERGPRRRWSYSEFARLPSDDGNRYEVIAGELHVTPAPRPMHQRAVARLTAVLETFADRHVLGGVLTGPVDVLFAEGDYLEPDVVFVRRDRVHIISGRGLEGAPDLVIEVLSDSTARRDRGIKRERYAHYGVPEYWIVDPNERRIELFDLSSDPERPEISDDVIVWRPVPGGPALEISVPEVLRSFRE